VASSEASPATNEFEVLSKKTLHDDALILSTFGTLEAPPPLFACVTITFGALANLLEVNVTVVPEAEMACDANVSTIGGGFTVESIVPDTSNATDGVFPMPTFPA
jgi:hypothetical protein